MRVPLATATLEHTFESRSVGGEHDALAALLRAVFDDGSNTDIVDLAPACGPHNRMVGNRPGQFTTGVYADGPDAGRVWWRRNSEPGAPPNPERHNRRPDVAALFARNLEQARAHSTHHHQKPRRHHHSGATHSNSPK